MSKVNVSWVAESSCEGLRDDVATVPVRPSRLAWRIVTASAPDGGQMRAHGVLISS